MDKICDSADLTTDMIGVSPKLSRYTPTPRSILFERISSLYSEIIFKIGSGGITDNLSNKLMFFYLIQGNKLKYYYRYFLKFNKHHVKNYKAEAICFFCHMDIFAQPADEK